MTEIITVGMYILGFVISTAVLAPWLFKTKREPLGNSKTAAFLLASAVSIAWPAAMLFFFLYKDAS